MTKTKLYKIIIIIIIIILILVGGMIFFFWSRAADEEGIKNNFQFLISNFQSIFNDSISNDQTSNIEQIQNSKQNFNLEENYQTYVNSKYNFSFKYPEGFTATEFEEGQNGDIILAQKAEENIGFQIFIIPFDEPGPITPERIRQDLPEMAIEEPQSVIIGKDNIKALIFFSSDSGFGRAREIWFVNNGYLYQISTYAELDGFIGKIMESWKFQ